MVILSVKMEGPVELPVSIPPAKNVPLTEECTEEKKPGSQSQTRTSEIKRAINQ